MRNTALVTAFMALALAGCETTGMAGTGQVVSRVHDQTGATPGNVLRPTGQGNSGGVLSVNGQPAAAGVEATMSYNAGGRGSGARVDFHNGPMAGTGVRCTRAGGGATVPECTAINAQNAYLVNEMSGVHSYAGAFAVNGYGPARNQNGFVAIHASPRGGMVQMPGNSVRYTGAFQSGGSLTTAGQTYSGRAVGSVTMQANFASGQLDGTFSGELRDDRTNLTTPLQAGFTGAVIDPNARFSNTSATQFSYGGAQAWGELDGAFYGPNAEEAAGAFGFGNSQGGMTGVMIGCSEYNPANCLSPSPRF